MPAAVYPGGSMLGLGTFAVAQRPGKYTWEERLVLHASPEGTTRVIAKPPLIEDDRWFMTVEIFGNSVPFAFIPQRAVDSALASFIPPPGSATEGPPDMPQRFQAIARQKMPPVYAPVQAIIMGLDKTVWITLRATAEGQMALIVDARGTLVGSLLVPPRSRLRQASATHVWMTEVDADGLTSVVRYRVSELACSSGNCR